MPVAVGKLLGHTGSGLEQRLAGHGGGCWFVSVAWASLVAMCLSSYSKVFPCSSGRSNAVRQSSFSLPSMVNIYGESVVFAERIIACSSSQLAITSPTVV